MDRTDIRIFAVLLRKAPLTLPRDSAVDCSKTDRRASRSVRRVRVHRALDSILGERSVPAAVGVARSTN